MAVKSSIAPVVSAHEEDEPLPQTLRFVLVLGAMILGGWFLVFALLQSRW